MEESPRAVTQGRVYFKTQQELPTYKNGKFEQCCTRTGKEMRRRSKESSRSCYESLDIPMNTMKFLCRSWSPTASNFLHTFSSSNAKSCVISQNQILDVDVKHGSERHEEEKGVYDSDLEEDGIVQVQVNDAEAHAAQTNYLNSASLANKIWVLISLL
ncbi:conserved hypothetical protein [Ricinus communis]|uniref:Uncharacterized protein n=1 Tax=Ricinus communis TaxID=3988 RepID=B9S1X1_RICCO|nr:conserved hypothetical protein [Ricinus communis]